MSKQDKQHFKRLKKALEEKFRERRPEVVNPIEDWSGQEIVDFQEDLLDKAGGRVSEKWFYTHIKDAKRNSLPRIDTLDLLSNYVGSRSWGEFKSKAKRSTGRKRIMLAGLLVCFGAVLLFLWRNNILDRQTDQPVSYKLCFYDAYTGEQINAKTLQIAVLKEGETPVTRHVSSGGCITLEEVGKTTLVVQAAYYKTDTIVRSFSEGGKNSETIRLQPDDYALMIHYFSTSKIEDWKKRREQLESMFTANARIFQVYKNNKGMELYNKEEFINKLTIPLESLQEIEVLQTEYDGDMIRLMRFTQKGE